MKMHRLLFHLFFLSGFLIPGPCIKAQYADSIKIMTWNIRLDVASDGEHQWKYRSKPLASFIMQQQPDVLGVQEAMHHQVRQIKCKTKGYKVIGVGRDDGSKGGEYNALYYKTNNLRLVRSGTFWLSETPDEAGSRGWDAACNRIATWAEFEQKKSGIHFFVMNTHFDHMGDTARINSAILIQDKLGKLAGHLPAILMGDFNVNSKHRVYRILTFPENEVTLGDTRKRDGCKKSGPDLSYVSFDPDYKPSSPIDFIFATWDFKIISSTIYDFRKNGIYWSDHLPVIVKMILPEK